MIHAAKADIVCPAVAAEDPLRLLSQEIFVGHDILTSRAINAFQSRHQLIGSASVQSADTKGIQPLLAGSLHFFGSSLIRSNCLNLLLQLITNRILSQQHTKTKLCIVLKQRVIPCRTLTFGIYRVRSGRRRVTPNGGTSRRIGNVHSVTEQLRDQLRIRSLTTTCTSAGELKQRLLELAALYRGLFELINYFLFDGNSLTEIINWLCIHMSCQLVHGQRLLTLLAWADIRTGTTSGTIQS